MIIFQFHIPEYNEVISLTRNNDKFNPPTTLP